MPEPSNPQVLESSASPPTICFVLRGAALLAATLASIIGLAGIMLLLATMFYRFALLTAGLKVLRADGFLALRRTS